VLLLAFAGCTANAISSSGGADSSPKVNEESFSPDSAVAYRVTSARAAKSGGENCLVAKVKMTNNGGTTIISSGVNRIPASFKVANSAGRAFLRLTEELSFAGKMAPATRTEGRIEFCGAEIRSGSTVLLLYGEDRWEVRVPAAKKKPVPKKPEPVEKTTPPPTRERPDWDRDRDRDWDDDDGARPGYRGPRCYAPGGRTWRPC
jgi:hypothetical protein